MSPLRISLVFIAIYSVACYSSGDGDTVVPEEEESSLTQAYASFVGEPSIEDALSFLQDNAEQSKTDPDGALHELTSMMQAAPKRDLSKLKAAIKNLIDDVKKEHTKDKINSQAKVDKHGAALQACGTKKETSQTHEDAVAEDQRELGNAEGHVKKKSTGDVDYDLGDSTASSAAAVGYVNTEMKRIKTEFDKLLGLRSAARTALKGSQTALKAANKALYDSKHQCFCLNKKSFDTNFKTLDDATQRNHELAHFHTVDCVVKEYEKGNFHNKALDNCKGMYDKLSKTKGLNSSSGKVNDPRFSSGCSKFSEQPASKTQSKYVATAKGKSCQDEGKTPILDAESCKQAAIAVSQEPQYKEDAEKSNAIEKGGIYTDDRNAPAGCSISWTCGYGHVGNCKNKKVPGKGIVRQQGFLGWNYTPGTKNSYISEYKMLCANKN